MTTSTPLNSHPVTTSDAPYDPLLTLGAPLTSPVDGLGATDVASNTPIVAINSSPAPSPSATFPSAASFQPTDVSSRVAPSTERTNESSLNPLDGTTSLTARESGEPTRESAGLTHNSPSDEHANQSASVKHETPAPAAVLATAAPAAVAAPTSTIAPIPVSDATTTSNAVATAPAFGTDSSAIPVTAKPKQVTPTSSPAASTPTKSAPASRAVSKKKKKPSLLASLFSCFSTKNVDEQRSSPSSRPAAQGVAEKKPTVAAPPASAAIGSHHPDTTTPATSAAAAAPLREKDGDLSVVSPVSRATSEGDKPAVVEPPLHTKPADGSVAAVGTQAYVEAIPRATETPARNSVGDNTGSSSRLQEVAIPSSGPTRAPLDETGGLTSSAVVPPGSGSHLLPHATPPSPSHSQSQSAETPAGSVSGGDDSYVGESGDEQHRYDQGGTEGEHSEGDEAEEDDLEDEDEEINLLGGVGIPVGPDGQPCPLLPPMGKHHDGRKCLVLDLDETLLHSSFKLIPQADYIVPVEIEGQTHNVYVIKRPGVDEFLRRMGEIYEVVIFTASLSKYADPVLDMLDIHEVVAHRLFRESCYNHKGNYVKDLSQLGRPIDETIIIDNSPASYIFHPNNAVPVSTWFNDPHDSELSDLIMFLADLADVDDVRGVLDGGLA